MNYTYGDGAHDHAVTSLSIENMYSDDTNGNMTTRHVYEGGAWKDYTLAYDAAWQVIGLFLSGTTRPVRTSYEYYSWNTLGGLLLGKV